MVALQSWFKEHWIKTVSKADFISWGRVNQKQYSDEELGWIYDSHVPAIVEEEVPGVVAPKTFDNEGVYIDTEAE